MVWPQSTYLGLREIHRAAQSFSPPAAAHLWVRADAVVFELAVDVTRVEPTPYEVHTPTPATRTRLA